MYSMRVFFYASRSIAHSTVRYDASDIQYKVIIRFPASTVIIFFADRTESGSPQLSPPKIMLCNISYDCTFAQLTKHKPSKSTIPPQAEDRDQNFGICFQSCAL